IAVVGTMAGAAQAQLIDDFSGGLGAYTLTRILDNGIAEANVSFSAASGALVASYGGTLSQAEQVVFLRNDYSLSVGSRLTVDAAFPTQTSQMDFGIAVGATATPTGAAVGSTDVRGGFNWAAVYIRPSQDAVRSTSAINGTVTTGSGILTAVETSVSKLFIERTSLTSFNLGYVDTSAVDHISQTVNFTATDVGTAIGFYADLRAPGGTLGSLDNLAVPEPSSFALAGLGFAAFGLFRRQRNSK
ncbi:MAG TPA: PEP-CTERM sorting domain-containing protein, partial [Candidatus Paceibacterota bacterium]|nr:PEP-CTERM sorting domain-containing protein [Candidatus Paceibacterota bacterium]